MTTEKPQDQTEAAGGASAVERVVRPLCEGQIMLVYLEFDRNADKNWTDAEYLIKFGEAVSEATVGVICRGVGPNGTKLSEGER